MYDRFKNKHVPSTLSNSHINNRYLSSPEIISKLNECQDKLRAAKHQLQLHQSIISEVDKRGVQLHNDMHNDLLSIMQNFREFFQIIH